MKRLAALAVCALALTGCVGYNGSSPSGVGESCVGSPVANHIVGAFRGTGQQGWALHIAWRESRCNPRADNPASDAIGLFQLLGHDDLLAAVCPSYPPHVSAVDAHCNARAARLLFDGSGRAPWGG